MDIKDKVAIVTGASSGIGLATAELFAENGAKVALAARTIEKLKEMSLAMPDSLAIQTDMRSQEQISKMISKVYEHYGRIDILINNAGQGMHVAVEHTNLDDYRSVFELNVVSVIAAMQGVIPIMRKQGQGVIINISSGLTKRIIPTVGPYASTKYALNAITLTARMELEKDNIKVGLVIPGITATNFFKNTIRRMRGTAPPDL
jgi:NADP-dependent 3-hydroxy acid dehydrogenase YdfG